MNIVRIFSFTILMGTFLPANSNSDNLPAPIPIDFGVNNGMRNDSTICESCNQEYDAEVMGASCCDEATQFNSDFTCEVLETAFMWNCSGCACTEDENNWTTDFGCMDMDACNYDSGVMYHYQGTCLSLDECGVCGGDGAVYECGCEDIPSGYCDCNGNVEDCTGVCGGSALEDDCGVCLGDGSTCISDIDGNFYQTIQIGEQLWMAENLKVTRYNDGSEIPNITNNEDWSNLSTGAYVNYDNNPSNSETYGRLYNWYTVDDDRGVCPDGYHVPADAEYTVLTDLLGGENVAGGKMKEAGLDHWNSPNMGATNESGFTGLPAGSRYNNGGNYYSMDYYGFFWSSSVSPSDDAWCRLLDYSDSDVNRTSSFHKHAGFSIRCLLSPAYGCADPEACNYDETATVDDDSCTYAEENYDCDGNCIVEVDCAGECGGEAVEDECGICGGSGIPDGDCDCDGNVDLGCGCGEDGPSGCDNNCGSTLELDECSICGGSGIPDGDCDCDGNVDLGCGCGEAGPSGCDNSCGSNLELDECGVCGGDNTSCSWTNLTAEVEELNNIHLSWDAVDSRSNSSRSSGNRNRDCSSGVCLYIENVDTGAGTLDIYMTNQAGCSYCTDPLYDNQDLCESWGDDGSGEAAWTINPDMNDNACTTANGVYFDGNVGGFQFELIGVTITGASGGTASEYFAIVNTTSTIILGFDLSGGTISPGSEILTQATFTDFVGESICFGTDPIANAISDAIGGSVSTEWGDCYCALALDECGVCGGSGIADGDCDCYGNIEDDCGVCGGDDSSCTDCNGIPNGDSVFDNCGTCDNDSSNDCDIDCSGDWGGSLENDECGICGGPGLGADSYYIDCWDGSEYCSNSDCPIDPSAVSYKIYRNGLGIAIAEVQGETGYTDINLDYNEQYCYTITYVNDGVESHHSNQACAITDAMPIVEGCMSSYACNYDENATVDDGSCWFVNTGCSCEVGQGAVIDNCGVCDIDFTNDCIPDCNGDWGGTAEVDQCGVCGGNGIADGECDCNGNIEDECGECGGNGLSCISWMELIAEGGENQILLSWEPVESARPSFMNRDGCEDDPDICIWNSWYYDFDNQQDCEASGGIWGSYLEYFGTSCSIMVNDPDAGCDTPILYWMVSDICPAACGECCGDDEACNTNEDGSCEYPEENYDCDGNCTTGEDCLGECGGSAEVDECGVCDGPGETEECGCEGIPDETCDCGGNILDECGECGGSGIPDGACDCDGNILDECGECGGDGLEECWDGSSECDLSDCPDASSVTYNVYRDGELLISGLDDASHIDLELGYSETHCYTVTYTNSGGIESDHSNEACAETNPEPIIPGCTNEDACNYNPDANEDDGSCILPEENYDCEGNCIVDTDCAGECGGSAEVDECGVCGGNGPEIECWDGELVCNVSDCTDQPEDSPFNFNQSSIQAFYHIFSAFDLDGNSLVPGEDWIGVFNGDVCVGAREWTDDNSTDIPAMGDDGYWYSIGYLQEGDYPEFQIFDASENQYYVAQPSENYPFSNNGVFSVESLSAGISYSLSLENHHNLVSFYALPEDVSIAGIMAGLGDNALSVVTEGNSAINLDGEWIGSLTEITPENGYWISISNFPDNLSVIGFDMDPDRMYDLHEGPNLISFPDSGSADLSSAIPDDVEHLFTAIISEGVSALNSDNGWAGSLTGFQGGAGYWVIVQEDLSFSYSTEDLLARSAHSFSEKLPDEDGFIVAQSSRQAFYYVDDIKLDNGGVEDGDWILSYNNDVLAGIRQWKGNTVDIPNMGSAGDMVTAGYFNEGDVPTFKLLRQSTGKIITLEGNIPNWSDNGIFILGELYEKQQIPELFVLNKAYPNPFNPTTTIGFGLPDQSEIIIEIYNLYGKRVEILVDKSIPAGYSSIVWNADKFSSGLYFVKLSANSLKGIKYTNIQKLMLVK